ncbi:MAG TPA: Hsp20/alpha crystallin family protein [Candidatus Hydrogenedens sp.]|nr:Hsp20/alpha crystallin family protein [Candidatus Hydrogenedens sp.]HOK09749.1 Hsp20/alpha crystallin family protein [Candidatus Hydrogenedens sp.]HOL19560.1 Hsp20/alpha crystallin family protein [Candidatus Hydrogenedens sp.]HPP58205.1 Hsp20/alpha crystallin family protein [Candidatus Hydrogenedens sp.]
MRRWWDPIQELEQIKREMDDLFRIFNEDVWDIPSFRFSFLPGISARTYPLVNIAEDKDNVYVEALAPGINPETLEVSVLNNTVRIAGEKPAVKDVKPEAFHRNERGAGKFIRTISLPVDVDSDKVKAEYKNGILMLTLPKAESAKPKQIAISVS